MMHDNIRRPVPTHIARSLWFEQLAELDAAAEKYTRDGKMSNVILDRDRNWSRHVKRMCKIIAPVALSPIVVAGKKGNGTISVIRACAADDWKGGRGVLICRATDGDDNRMIGIRRHAVIRSFERLGLRHWRELVEELQPALSWLQLRDCLTPRSGNRFVLPLVSGHSAVGVWKATADSLPVPVVSTILHANQYTAAQAARFQRAAGLLLDGEVPPWPGGYDAAPTASQRRVLEYWQATGLRSFNHY